MGKKEKKGMNGTNRKLMKVFFGATIAAIVPPFTPTGIKITNGGENG